MELHNKRKILVIDDNPINLALLKAHLKNMDLESILVDNAAEGIETAGNESPDLILLDIMMPDMDGYEACKILKNDPKTSKIPIIIVSAKDRSEDKVTGLKLGAIDYISKPFDPGELKARIDIILQMICLQERLLAQANTDELTGLANRRHFMEILEREVLQAKVKGIPLSVIMIDIDHFKQFNDTYGHFGGDVILRQIARLFRDNIFPLDIAARYGGEEFIIIMPHTDKRKGLKAAERLRALVESTQWQISITDCPRITISLGLAVMEPENSLDPYDLIKRADSALYAAKRYGRNRVVQWDQVDADDDKLHQESQDVQELQKKIQNLVVQMRSQVMGSVVSLNMALAAKDPFTASHAENVQVYAEAIARGMNLTPDLIEQISNAALLHDVGKLSVPVSILTKETPLTEEEHDIIKQHPLVGVQIISPLGMFTQELQIIKHHHECFDGSGYPDGLQDKRIPFGARILAVADTFDAMCTDRQFRSAFTREEALAEIKACVGTQFDPEIVDIFLRVAEEYSSDWPLPAKIHTPAPQLID